MDHRFSQATPGQYVCSCGWQGSDFVAHRQQTTLAALRETPAPVRTIHETPREV